MAAAGEKFRGVGSDVTDGVATDDVTASIAGLYTYRSFYSIRLVHVLLELDVINVIENSIFEAK